MRDTIDQWLEAQVMEVRDNKVFIHYNGWGNRWDEWIDKDSDRIALFRTHTIQNPKSHYLSPFPNVLPEMSAHQINQAFDTETLKKMLDKV